MDKTQSDFNGGYKIKNLKFTGITCKTNMPSNTAFRSFGSPEGLLVMEDIIFKIACNLGLSQETVCIKPSLLFSYIVGSIYF